MNELIKVTEQVIGKEKVNGVNARELYEFLEIKSNFTEWMSRMVDYGFTNGIDYITFSEKRNRQILKEYAITLDMAKEISMIQRSDKGKQARQYFIQCEKKLKEITMNHTPSYQITNPIERAKAWIVEQEEHQKQIELKNKQIEYKDDTIIALTDDIDLHMKKQRISEIVKSAPKGKQQERFRLLYNEFKNKYHIDVYSRHKNAIKNGTIKKSNVNKLGYICDILGMTDQLFRLTVKIFETDAKRIYKNILDII